MAVDARARLCARQNSRLTSPGMTVFSCCRPPASDPVRTSPQRNARPRWRTVCIDYTQNGNTTVQLPDAYRYRQSRLHDAKKPLAPLQAGWEQVHSLSEVFQSGYPPNPDSSTTDSSKREAPTLLFHCVGRIIRINTHSSTDALRSSVPRIASWNTRPHIHAPLPAIVVAIDQLLPNT